MMKPLVLLASRHGAEPVAQSMSATSPHVRHTTWWWLSPTRDSKRAEEPAGSVLIGGRGAGGHPEVARAALVDLELDRARPHLVGTPDVVEDAAVARLAVARSKSALAPLELGAQIVVLVLLLGDDVAHLLARDVDQPLLDLKDVAGVGIQPGTRQKRVELVQGRAVKQDDCRLVLGNAGSLRPNDGCARQPRQEQYACRPAAFKCSHRMPTFRQPFSSSAGSGCKSGSGRGQEGKSNFLFTSAAAR